MVDGRSVGQVGNFHLDCCYGGYQVAEIVNVSGGIRTYVWNGTKREALAFIWAMITGVQAERRAGLGTPLVAREGGAK